ncbi:zinc-finger domain-containing protein [Psychrobacillus sp.]|uniref:zinc-finger domain-containing protein n=1 Tax=Psychrobacillus sp. TaxID=1871623 RepID=UPI0028BDF1FB|nr:zinc-finger domain-containing protein [Psychrobacillus sp.]
MKKVQIIQEIDYLLTKYCEECFVRTQLRKERGRAGAHSFCIDQCTVGEKIKHAGTKLAEK